MIPRPVNGRTLAGLIALSLGCVAAGAGAMWWMLRPGDRLSHAQAVPVLTAEAAPSSAPAEIAFVIAPDLVARAAIERTAAVSGHIAEELRVPAVLEVNAYRNVEVVATSGGEVLDVPVVLGQRVARGDALVRLHSPEVAAVEQEYVSVLASIDASARQVVRLDRLVAIGGASRQDLEAARANDASLAAARTSLRARLRLLGRDEPRILELENGAQVSPVVVLRAPTAGTVVDRPVTLGRTIEPGAALVRIADLSTLWGIGAIYERDLGQVDVGSRAELSSVAFPGETFTGRVSYLDPEVSADTRTVRVRVELQNPRGRLRPGMLMAMVVAGPDREAVLVPSLAVQVIGDVSVVYVVDPVEPGRFIERSVRTGGTHGDRVAVVSGLSAGETVVSRGSFLVRAERERRSLPPPVDPPMPAPAPPPKAGAGARVAPFVAEIAVTAEGFVPAEIVVPAGRALTLRFTRTTDATCATEVVFDADGVRRALPLGETVDLQLPARPAGTLGFACGMKMFRGVVVIR